MLSKANGLIAFGLLILLATLTLPVFFGKPEFQVNNALQRHTAQTLTQAFQRVLKTRRLSATISTDDIAQYFNTALRRTQTSQVNLFGASTPTSCALLPCFKIKHHPQAIFWFTSGQTFGGTSPYHALTFYLSHSVTATTLLLLYTDGSLGLLSKGQHTLKPYTFTQGGSLSSQRPSQKHWQGWVDW